MALRSFISASRIMSRRLATSVEQSSTKGPKLPLGNDPAAFHPREHAVNDSNRWKMISMVFGVPVMGFFVLEVTKNHEHSDPPPEYPYLKMANRSPRFPWGEDDLIGTPHDRHEREAGAHGH